MMVMVGVVGYVGDLVVVWLVVFVWMMCIEQCVDCMYYFDVFFFGVVVYVVGFVDLVFGQYGVDCFVVVGYEQLVLYLFVVVIYWQGFVGQCFGDYQWDEFFGEVVWVVVVGVVGGQYW